MCEIHLTMGFLSYCEYKEYKEISGEVGKDTQATTRERVMITIQYSVSSVELPFPESLSKMFDDR